MLDVDADARSGIGLQHLEDLVQLTLHLAYVRLQRMHSSSSLLTQMGVGESLL